MRSQAEETSHKETHHSAKQGKYIALLMLWNTALNDSLKMFNIRPHLSNWTQSNLFINRSQEHYKKKIHCIRKIFCVNLHMETH